MHTMHDSIVKANLTPCCDVARAVLQQLEDTELLLKWK